MTDITYRQFTKNKVRHDIIQKAVSLLTTNRSKAPCVHRDYVRNVYDYFTTTDDDNGNKAEALKIKPEHILQWENLHDACCSSKKAYELNVCYLCGPEPNNDFDEFIHMGILPQNIWAFETDTEIYKKALSVYEKVSYQKPRIIKQNIEAFFKQTPKKFDIIYIDACGSIPSSRHALRCVSTAFLCNRLNSPGIIITNFAEPDCQSDYLNFLTDYFYAKKNIGCNEVLGGGYEDYNDLQNKIITNFSDFYGNFISLILRDISSIIVPLQRVWKNPYIEQIFDFSKTSYTNIDKEFLEDVNDSITHFFLDYEISKQKGNTDTRMENLIKEIGEYDILKKALYQYELIKSGAIKYNSSSSESGNYWDIALNMYQFLDKPHNNLFLDIILNQLAYPSHVNTKEVVRYKYKAKTKVMYTDITIFDECRYIYEWLPAIHQIKAALTDLSYQHVFQFALDGLIKSRLKYNNEFFFQGSVIPDMCEDFKAYEMDKRIEVQ